ncbi:MAG TPA: DegV family protein [Candidatus Limadaptatus stercoravium]|nr:DegV family protein [Candidatus Limadaptatus stercoravium]
MAVFFCDTDCELWYTTAKELGVKVIPMPYTVDGEERLYDLGENTDLKAFFDRMRAGAAVSTAGLNPQTYIDIFEPYFKAGEEVLYVAFSSRMSNTFSYLDTAIAELKAKYPDAKYRRYDTLNISMGAGIMVYLAAKFFNAHGGDVDATCAYLDTLVQNVAVLFVVDDLKFLARGGRLSPAKAKIGNVLQLKPVLYVNKEGEIDVLTKQNGFKKAMSFIVSEFARKYRPVEGAPVVIVGADCDGYVAELRSRIEPEAGGAEIIVQPVGPVIGAHCGPGTYGIIFTAESR